MGAHYDLCQLTTKRFLKDSKVVVFEYQSFATNEYPDVLCYGKHTILFEIKVSKSDFKQDSGKRCRSKVTIKYFPYLRNWMNTDRVKSIDWKTHGMQEFIREAPHLGRERYYVCPEGLIKPDEVLNGWGLYWVKDGKFRKKKASKTFRNNIHDEIALVCHAFRKYASGDQTNVLVNTYKMNKKGK